MNIPLNSSGLPKGSGTLQVRGRVYWAIYTDETGRSNQVNTQTADLAEARHFLALRALLVLQAKVAALEGVLDETRSQGRQGHRAVRSRSGEAVLRGARHTNSDRRKAQKS